MHRKISGESNQPIVQCGNNNRSWFILTVNQSQIQSKKQHLKIQKNISDIIFNIIKPLQASIPLFYIRKGILLDP